MERPESRREQLNGCRIRAAGETNVERHLCTLRKVDCGGGREKKKNANLHTLGTGVANQRSRIEGNRR